jgi:DNA polymerase
MDDRQQVLLAARRIVAERLESLIRAGVSQIGRAPERTPALTDVVQSAVAVASPDPAPFIPTVPASPAMPRPKLTAGSPQPPVLPLTGSASLLHQPYDRGLADDAAGRQQLLDAVNEQVRACRLCEELACQRKQTVFGVGHIRPRVVFFGEAPGADEDRLGEPMVGRAGQLQTKIIEACGWKREDVYIMNVLKCRPPDNRNPLPQETSNCRPFFERQLAILRPEFIVCVGSVAAQALLETTDSVGKLRGRFHKYRDSTVLVTYHPSYLLRNPSAKKYVWEDMQTLLGEMGLPIPGRAG